MAFADWMIPKPSLAAQAQLQHTIHALRARRNDKIETMLDTLESLLQLHLNYSTLLNQAIAHIAEIEAKEILKESASQRPPSAAAFADPSPQHSPAD